jgi:hypothetical protein
VKPVPPYAGEEGLLWTLLATMFAGRFFPHGGVLVKFSFSSRDEGLALRKRRKTAHGFGEKP